jgi:pyruvate,water dikinase
VTEVGSSLSHGAVVAREYGLPLIANVTNATLVIQDGDYVSVDANKGEVLILSEEEYHSFQTN